VRDERCGWAETNVSQEGALGSLLERFAREVT
jgi:hypothetical protein